MKIRHVDWSRIAILTAVTAALAVGIAAAFLYHSSRTPHVSVVRVATSPAGTSRHTMSSPDPTAQGKRATTASSTVLRRAAKCLPKGRKRLGPAPRYVGLTFAAAQRLTNSPIFAGGGGHCSTFDDDVYRTHPIAVVYNTGNARERKARTIAAVRAVAGWQPGN